MNDIIAENVKANESDLRSGNERRVKEVFVLWGKQRWGDRRAIISKPEMECLMKYDIDDLRQIEKLGHADRQLSAINQARKDYGLVRSEVREQVFLDTVKRILEGKSGE